MPASREDIAEVLRGIPLDNTVQESHAQDMFNIFVSLRNAAFDGAGISIPGFAVAGGIPGLVQSMKNDDYWGVAGALVGMAGDAAGAYSFIVTAGIEAGAISGTGAVASSGVVTGMLGEAAGPLGIAISVAAGVYNIPSDASANLGKMYFVADASGIFASWVFNMPEISPHSRLTRQARHGGYMRADISSHTRQAHDAIHNLWAQRYRGNRSAIQQARRVADGRWQSFWQAMANGLDARLRPFPSGSGASMARRLIRETEGQLHQRDRAARQQELIARQRRLAGGVWVTTQDGIELFIPDA